MNNRIAQVIVALGIKKIEFAKRLGISSPFVSELCSGAKKASDRTIADICREFSVSETWLRTGEGEMFVKKEPQPLDELLAELLDGKTVTDEDKVLMKNFLELSDASRQEVIAFVRHCAQELPAAGEDIPVPATMDTGGQERAQSDVAARVEELERQNKELAAKVAAMEEEDAKMEAAAELSLGKPFSGGTKTG